MLNLIAGEFAKLKRKKIVPFIILLSLLFPLIVVYTSKMGMGNDTSVEFLKGRFDLSYTMMLGYGLVFGTVSVGYSSLHTVLYGEG